MKNKQEKNQDIVNLAYMLSNGYYCRQMMVEEFKRYNKNSNHNMIESILLKLKRLNLLYWYIEKGTLYFTLDLKKN